MACILGLEAEPPGRHSQPESGNEGYIFYFLKYRIHITFVQTPKMRCLGGGKRKLLPLRLCVFAC